MADVISKFNDILKDKNIDINNVLGSTGPKETSDSNKKSSFEFDINTLLKFKKIFDGVNNSNNPRNSLLYSLKPFLRDNRKEKLEQYIKIANILYIMNYLNESGDLKK